MLLDADCVFTNLLRQNVLVCKTNGWKGTSTSQTAPYICEFFINKNNLKIGEIIRKEPANLLL